MRAICRLRESPVYRRGAFLEGLSAAGFEIADGFRPSKGDVLVIWNRYGSAEQEARSFEQAGGRVWVAENGYFGKMWRGQRWFAIAEGHHAGAGYWPVGGPERWDSWGVELGLWRESGERVILGQRGFGEQGIAAPERWAERIRRQFPGRIRAHPGGGPCVSLEEDLRDAGEVLTWNSGAALQALVFGVPVRCAFDRWIGRSASAGMDEPLKRDDSRLPMFRRLAWAMWSEEEVSSGEPFRRLLHQPQQQR